MLILEHVHLLLVNIYNHSPTVHSFVCHSFASSFVYAASLLNLLVVTAAKRCPFLSQLRSKTTSVWNRTCNLSACTAPPGMYSRSAVSSPHPPHLSVLLLPILLCLCLTMSRVIQGHALLCWQQQGKLPKMWRL